MEAIIEEYSVSYVNEENKVYTTPENGGQGGVDYSAMYTTFEALEDGTFSFTKNGMQYSKDNGSTWTPLASGEDVDVVTGDNVMWKSTITPSIGMGEFSSSNKFNVCGNIMSLLYGDDFVGQTSLEGKNFVFYNLFNYCRFLIDASNLILPATTLLYGCYYEMFKGCTSLTTAPELPATELADSCYVGMFSGCTNLTNAPELPATILASNCYYNMFNGCTNLNHITMLATDISATTCLTNWVNNVSSTGTFVKHPDMTSLPTGSSGIPNGWTVEDAVL